MFGTDLSQDYDAAASLGLHPREAYDAGLEGALCDEKTKARLREIAETFSWGAIRPLEGKVP